MLDVNAAVRTCQLRLVLLQIQKPGAETLCLVSQLRASAMSAASYRVAVGMTTCYCVWLVE